MRMFAYVVASCALAISTTVIAQVVGDDGAAGSARVPPAPMLPAGTVVDFEITDHVNSKLSKAGDLFHIRTVKPLMAEGREIIPVGATGMGEVIHAARARAGGKAGELILAARYIETGDRRIALRSFRFGLSGDNRTDEGVAVAMLVSPLLAYLVVGGEVDVPPLTAGHAKLVTDVDMPVSASAQHTRSN